MVKDATGREGLSAAAIAKELDASGSAVKKALAEMKVAPDFVKAGCAYYYLERVPAAKKTLP